MYKVFGDLISENCYKVKAESNAILYYLADGSFLIATDQLHKTQVLQWLFFKQYSHEPYIAVSGFIKQFTHPSKAEKRALLEQKHSGGVKALMVIEAHLKNRVLSLKIVIPLPILHYMHIYITQMREGFHLQNM